MREGDIRIFKNPVKYQELLRLLKLGWDYHSIAEHFDCHRTTIIHQARKLGVPPRVSEKTRSYKPTPMKDYYENNERINLGKSYKEYLDIERNRNPSISLKEIIKR